MKSIGVRRLRQEASAVLRLVERGESFEITDRGRAIALLSPRPAGTPLAELRASGELSTASGDIDDLPPPLAVPPGRERPSRVLARLRAHER
jgi:antitoxin (DNA-binding transcriptional repressor) of toxin-antitoxin stability system